jgi:hypothetical protein
VRTTDIGTVKEAFDTHSHGKFSAAAHRLWGVRWRSDLGFKPRTFSEGNHDPSAAIDFFGETVSETFKVASRETRAPEKLDILHSPRLPLCPVRAERLCRSLVPRGVDTA